MKFKFTILIFAVAAVAIFFMRQENFVPRTSLDIYQHFTDKTEADAIPGLTTESALEIQKHVVYALSEDWGGIAGYKAAITNQDSNRKWASSSPY